MKTTFLFPGQGSQSIRMLSSMDREDPIVNTVFAEVENQLKVSVESLDTAEKLNSTVYVQLCLLISGVISARQLLSQKITPDYLAGHSIGAFAAAVISEAISFTDALNLVLLRATMMEQAYPEGYGMAAVVGFSESRLSCLLGAHNLENDALYLANSNAYDQQVVAGQLSSIDKLIPSLQRSGARKVQVLSVSVPSHCPLLNDVSVALEEALMEIKVKEPIYPCVSNHTGRIVKSAELLRKDLYKSISEKVRWYEGTTLLYESGVRLFIEMAPSGVLAKIASSTFPEVNVIGFDEQDLNTIKWLYDHYNSNNY
ncbi:malonate decarboxylase subunit epsilon [Chryseobacterium carnipullorum]|uniref:Malonyl CoA-acyl carrier protein transacylase n=2 Tax=Chryseobacterium carnipullorum TaxID=1124835 RepID=A0A3G6M993_CHRCU|nr:malonate decarboxylase subunit epsilon [Chryseobacterium carnipullorum]AZA49469.1 malonate decarboxylase subunit epsilon [Chryseobacterium carnipullorum]AZA64362.1 malonate decarboxylase subunit epsilon [Chryseobacterium carnipullorum]